MSAAASGKKFTGSIKVADIVVTVTPSYSGAAFAQAVATTLDSPLLTSTLAADNALRIVPACDVQEPVDLSA